MPLFHRETPDLTAYRELRAASHSWFPKVMQYPAAKQFDMTHAAKKLGLPVRNGTIVFDDEQLAPAVLADYFLIDYRPAGKSLCEACQFAPGELTAAEADLHAANIASRTSLFELAGIHPTEPKILLRDRLERGTPDCWLTDVGLTNSLRDIGVKALLYTRIVTARGVSFTGGFSFVFDPKHEFALIDGYRRAMWSVPAEKRAGRITGYFLAQNRRWGMAQQLEDPPT